jgi:predicted phage-related endonuclease
VTQVHQYRSREEWLQHRRIGSSDVAAILGLSRYRGPWEVLERLRGEAPFEPSTPDQERGRRLEPVVLRRYAQACGLEVTPTPAHTLYTREDWASATPDALARGGLVIEAKTDRHASRWGEPATIERWTPDAERVVRGDYYLQVAHQLWVLDAPAADLAVLVPGDDPFLPELRVYRILRDRELEARLTHRLRTWWNVHVVQGEMLDPDGSPAASRLIASNVGTGTRRATPQLVALAAQYEVARRNADEWDRAKRRLGQELVVEAGANCDRIDLPVGRVAIVRTEGRTTLDERALLADHPELAPVLAEYRRRSSPTVYPRISGLGSMQ